MRNQLHGAASPATCDATGLFVAIPLHLRYSLLTMPGAKQTRRRGFTRLSSKRQVTLPIRVVDELHLETGDEFQVEADRGRIILSRTEAPAAKQLRAIDQVAGTVAGLWKPGDLDRLRDEWR